MKKIRLLSVLLCLPFWLLAQKEYSGKVLDSTGHSPLSGAVIQLVGSSVMTVSSDSGTFTLTAAEGSQVKISLVGFRPLTQKLAENPHPTFILSPEAGSLEQVIVVGYGTSSKKDLTAPIATVNTEDLVKRTTANPMDAIQGSVSGVQVVSNGAPGSSPSVRIRGVGSFNNENPLYVVDGMFVDDISFLNNNDIADMSVLKDASAAAIYGVRAANGVVIITTKKGKMNMPTRVTYNGYVGIQRPVNMLKMADAAQYSAMELAKMTASDSAHVTLSVDKFGGTGLTPSTNTDWYRELLKNNALIHNHSLDLAGGSDKVNYTIGLNYMYQDGIMKAKNDFERYNIRLQTEAKPYNWLKVGYTAIITNSTQFTPNSGAFMNAYYSSPLFPVYDPSNSGAYPTAYASSTSIGFNNGVFNNPIATADYYYDRTKMFQILPTLYAEASFWNNKLTYRSQWSMRYASNNEVKYIQDYYVDNNQRQAKSNLWSAQNRYNDYILDNLLTYKDGKNGHHWSLMLGQSSREQRWRQTWVSADSVPNVEEFWYVGQGVRTATNYSEDGSRNAGLSYFSRATYDYRNKYLLTATFRADGSSKYQTKWGYFPSVGLGWVLTEEDFMKNQKLFQFLKLRGSWGKLGNDGINANAGYATVQTGNDYSGIYGSTGAANGNYVIGYFVNSFFTPIRWEVVEEWDGGLDFTMASNKLKGSVDYYHRATNNVAFSKTQAFTNTTLYGNWASVANSGWEFNLNWSDNIGTKFSYNLGANLTTLKNRVTDLGSLSYMMTGVTEFPTRIEVGQPMNYFFGYQMTGVYQNQVEIDADPTTAGQGIKPGYLKFKDQNGDGGIDASDRVNLGSYLPKITYGFNIGVSYDAFDLSVVFQGVSGNKILNLNRAMRLKYSDMNGDADLVSHLWTSENSTNAYPSAYATTQGWNNQASSFFVESGSYLRVQNIQLGYNFHIGDKGPRLRVFATADRPFIFTKYNGFSPEVTGTTGTIANTGYDSQIYPVSATYSFGVRATF